MLNSTVPLTLRRSFSNYNACLAGHNKWSKIKQKKGMMDAQKGAIYSKISRDIVLAVRNGGSTDPTFNLLLASVLRRAKEQDVPRDNVERALARAEGAKERAGEALTYEALAHNSVGLIIECLTNNANRTVRTVREVLTAHSARFAPVKYMFTRKGCVRVCIENGSDTGSPIDEILDAALESGAEDFEQDVSNQGVVEIEFTCEPNALSKVTLGLTRSPFCELLNSELVYAPIQPSETSRELESEISNLIEELEAYEDTLRVWTSLATR